MKNFGSFSAVFIALLVGCTPKPKTVVPEPQHPVTVRPDDRSAADEDLLPNTGFYNNADGSPVFAMLNGAKHSLEIEIYQMEDADVRAALRAAIARKVRLRVVKEPKPLGDDCIIFSPVNDQDNAVCRDQKALRDEIIASGGTYVPFNKSELCGGNPARCFEHGKMIISDGRVVMLSTGNFNSSNLCNAAQNPEKCNRDFSFVSRETETVTFLANVFEHDVAQTRYDLKGMMETAQMQDKVTVSPHSLEPLVRFVQSAKTSIRIQNQYLKETTFNDALKTAAQNHIRVEVTLASLCAFGPPSQRDVDDATQLFTAFEAAGILIRMLPSQFKINGRPGYLHSKAIVVDDAVAWVGSVNGSNSAFSVNREFGIFFREPGWVSSLQNILVTDHGSTDMETWQESLQCLKDRA